MFRKKQSVAAAAAQLRGILAGYDLVITHTSLAAFFTRWAAKGLKKRPRIINVVHCYLFDDQTAVVKKMFAAFAKLKKI